MVINVNWSFLFDWFLGVYEFVIIVGMFLFMIDLLLLSLEDFLGEYRFNYFLLGIKVLKGVLDVENLGGDDEEGDGWFDFEVVVGGEEFLDKVFEVSGFICKD